MKILKFSIAVDTRATTIFQQDENYVIRSSNSFTPGGIEMCEGVVEHLKTNHQFFMGRLSAEMIILSVGSALPVEQNQKMEFAGRNMETGLPQKRDISTSLIEEPIHRIVDVIVATVSRRIRRITNAVSSDVIVDPEIALIGEYRKLHGLDALLEQSIRAKAIPQAVVVVRDSLLDRAD